MTRTQKIITLWGLVLAGFLAHSMADMLPIYWGKDIAIDHSGIVMALFNMLHDGGELIMAFNAVQAFVLPLVLCFSVLLAIESYKLYKEAK